MTGVQKYFDLESLIVNFRKNYENVPVGIAHALMSITLINWKSM